MDAQALSMEPFSKLCLVLLKVISFSKMKITSTLGYACSAHSNASFKGGKGKMSLNLQLESKRTLVAFAKIRTDNPGEFPSITNQDEYLGFLRFDEVGI